MSKKIYLDQKFKWFSKIEILHLLNEKNLINMDTLSVFSSFIKKRKIDFPLNKEKTITTWKNSLNRKYFLKNKIINLNLIKNWNLNKKKILHKTNDYFSVIGIKVKTNKREITDWCQPIIKASKMSFVGYLTKKFRNTNHYLCRYIIKPGSKIGTYTCSVNTSHFKGFKKSKDLSSFQKKLISNYFTNSNGIIYDNILSLEGGRFYHSQVKYMACKLDKNQDIELPEHYIWLSQNQMIDLINRQNIDIEARLLFGIINFKEVL